MLLPVVLLLGGVLAYLMRPMSGIRGPSRNHGENGLWLRYKWYFGEHTNAEIEALGRQLAKEQIRYAWFHVRDIRPDGRLLYRQPEQARRLTAALRAVCPLVRCMAWIYAECPAVDLKKERVRRAMTSEARWLVEECGFDGVQWDYEILPDGDDSFLELLRETRDALPKGATLGAAIPMWMPPPVGAIGLGETYNGRIAAECDQIAVMCYDSGMPLARSYVWLVGQQAVRATRAAHAANPHCRVLLGVPTYGKAGPAHNVRVETLENAIRGVREGLADPAAALESFAGLALFADYTTTAAHWRQYEQLWPKQ